MEIALRRAQNLFSTVSVKFGHGAPSPLRAAYPPPGRRGRCPPRPPQIRTRRFPASGSSRESFADDVMDDHIGRSAHRHSLLGQTFSLGSPISSAIHAVSWTQVTGSSVPPVFLDMVLSSRRLPSLLRVPSSLVPRSHRYYEGATTSHLRVGGRLFCSLPPPT